MKFTQTHTDYVSDKPIETVSIEIAEHSNIGTVLEAFTRFLRAAGYYFDGEVEIVDHQAVDHYNDFDDSIDSITNEEDEIQFEGPIEGFSQSTADTNWPFPTTTKP